MKDMPEEEREVSHDVEEEVTPPQFDEGYLEPWEDG
jgi:hypothetical protein